MVSDAYQPPAARLSAKGFPASDSAETIWWDALTASWAATTLAGEAALRTIADVLSQVAGTESVVPEPLWATPHRIVAETAIFRLRDFSRALEEEEEHLAMVRSWVNSTILSMAGAQSGADGDTFRAEP